MAKGKTRTAELAKDIASTYLERHGIEIVERSYRCDAGTVDLICREDDDLVFAIVKHRKGFGLPEDGTTPETRTTMENVALHYLSNHDVASCKVRFDVIALVICDDSRAFLRHHRDALSAA